MSVAALVGTLVGLGASPGSAAPAAPNAPTNPAAPPRTSGQALEQLRKLNFQLERTVEDFNDARVLLKKRTGEALAAQGKARSAAAAYTKLSGQVHQIVRSAYATAPFSRMGTMLTSDSPQDFLDGLAALDVVARRQAALLATAARTRTAADRASADAKTKLAAANKLTRDLAARKADLSKRVAESRRLLASLTAKERAAFLADPVPTDQRASRGGTRPPPQQGPTKPPPSNGPVSGAAGIALATARAQLGKPYVSAGDGPDGFDCSGLTKFAWASAGVTLPRVSRDQIGVGRNVSMSQLQPGDLVFFYSPISHVGIYEGNGVMIHAPTEGDVVKRTEIQYLPFAGATRPTG